MSANLFRIAVTCIICRTDPDGKREYLILKRSPKERHGSEMWTVAGGIIEAKDWKEIPSDYTFPLWYDVGIKAVKREVLEETGLTIINPKYLCDCIFIHKSNIPEIVLSYYATNFKGEIKLSEEHTEYAWVSVDDLDKYNLLVDIPMEIRTVDKTIMYEMERVIYRCG